MPNGHATESRGLWINHRTSEDYADWSDGQLVHITSRNAETTELFASSRAHIQAPIRGYAIWMPR